MQLRLGRFTVEFDGHRLAVKGAPRLDVGPIDCRAARHEDLGWNSGPASWVANHCGVDPSGGRFEHLAQLHEESFDTVIGLGRIPAMDIETVALLLTQGIRAFGLLRPDGPDGAGERH